VAGASFSFVVILLLLVGATLHAADAAAEPPAMIPPLASPPPLDPHLPASSWPENAPAFVLGYDVVHQRAVDAPPTVRMASDAHVLYVRFDVPQRETPVATQHSNDTISGGSGGNNGSLSWSTDDAVWIDLWPSGTSGFSYQFEANPNGSHNESSSENSAFAPQWESRGAVHDGGYTVTMAIPLAVIHGAHSGTWRIQLIRYNRANGAEDVWAHAPGQTNADSVAYSGSLQLAIGKTPLPKPRAAIYALGTDASAAAGGSTSRVGADLSIPITPTAAVFAALHPDYSNVELDQQTISPTVYQRQYSEVRPFFTQAASYYDNFNCTACNVYYTTLYTPAIPTFADGYAIEGKAAPIGFAAFDARSSGRDDRAGAVDYVSPDNRWAGAFQHVTADLPGLVDDSNQVGVRWSDLKYLDFYANASDETGTLVTKPGLATTFEGGGAYVSTHFSLAGAVRSVGPQFDPVDGYVVHSGIAGYSLYSARIWDFAAQDVLASIGISAFGDRYQGPIYGQSQSDNQVLLDVLTKSAWDLQLYSGSDYWRFGESLTPISQNGGFQLTYHGGVQTDNPGGFPSHGTSAFPTQITYATGRYGLGRLDTWFRTSTVRAGDKGNVTFTLDNTSQWLRAGPNAIQWFEGVAYSYQISRDSSFAIGLRRVVGNPPNPNGGGDCIGVCSNVSVAYHLRLKHEELYFAYGDPNTLSTVPQALVKLIYYVGGQKGT